ncbi:MAG: hypothetical protein HONBIEJF_00642 [Fimbriimonadaceae bacterium]|nr:hypothetical protein [Fimbriimonadaceae bacterium]
MFVAALVWSGARVLSRAHYLADRIVLVLCIAMGIWGVITATGPPVQLGVV